MACAARLSVQILVVVANIQTRTLKAEVEKGPREQQLNVHTHTHYRVYLTIERGLLNTASAMIAG